MKLNQVTYSTHHPRAAPALVNHIPSASSDLATRDAADFLASPRIRSPLLYAGIQSIAEPERRVCPFVLAAKCLFNQELAELEQIRPKLTACSGELMQGIEVHVARELRDDAGGLLVTKRRTPLVVCP